MTSYDDWKCDADAAPDPGHGDALSYRLSCRNCDWSVRDGSMIAAAKAARKHQLGTQHAILYKGVVQQWTTTCVRCGGEAPIPEGGDWRSITWCPTCDEKARQQREQRQERTA